MKMNLQPKMKNGGLRAVSAILLVVMLMAGLQLNAKDVNTWYKFLSAIQNGENVRLTAAIDVQQTIVLPNNSNVTIDLNGYTLRGDCRFFTLWDGYTATLTITGGGNLYGYGDARYDCLGGCVYVGSGCTLVVNGQVNIHSFKTYNYGGGAVYVNEGGTFNMTNGVIFDCYNSYTGQIGGAVYNKGTFNMSSGTISSCTASYGGGVYNEGTFNMSGGTITSCTVSSDGGGVYNKGTFNMTGSAIIESCTGTGVYSTGTTTINGGIWIRGCSGGYGGALRAVGGTTYFYQGNIYNNSSTYGSQIACTNDGNIIINGSAANIDANDVQNMMGAVFIQTGNNNKGVTFQNGTIKNSVANSDDIHGGGVTIYSGKFEMSGGTIYNCRTTASGGGIWVANGLVSVSGGSIHNCTASGNGGAICSSQSNNTINISGSADIYSNTAANGGAIFGYGTWNITGGTLRNCTASVNGGGIYYGGGTFNATGGSVHDCYAQIGGGVYVAGGTFTQGAGHVIYNCYANKGSWNGGGGLCNGGGVSHIYGVINGNHARCAGGIGGRGGTIYLYEGAIVRDNKCDVGTSGLDGAGVLIDGGDFVMKGGLINGNTGATTYSGVVAWSNTFTMYGGVISDNTATGDAGKQVACYNGTVVLKGGILEQEPTLANVQGNAGTFTEPEHLAVNGKYIVGDNMVIDPSPSKDGDVDGVVKQGTFTFNFQNDETKDADVNLTVDDEHVVSHSIGATDTWTVKTLEPHVHCICGDGTCTAEGHSHEDITWTPWYGETALPTEEGNYYLINDVTLSDTYTPVDGVNICLNGHVVRQTGSGKSVVTVGSAVNFTITDCDKTTEHNFKVGSNGLWTFTSDAKTVDYENLTSRPDENAVVAVKGGAITGGNASKGGGIYNSGTINLYAGNIVGNSSTSNGGGIYNVGGNINIFGTADICGNLGGYDGGGVFLYSGALIANGGSVSYNITGATTGGGGLYLKDGSSTLTGATIKGNSAAYGAGVVSKEGDGTGTFNFVNCTITGNICRNWGGGGICASKSSVSIVGGTISGNSAGSSSIGGGVLLNESASLTLGGDVKITGNNVGGNLYLDKNSGVQKTVAISTDNALTSGTSIGVTTATAPTASAPVAVTSNGTMADMDYFSSDNSAYTTIYQDSKVKLALIGSNVCQVVETSTLYTTVAAAIEAATDGQTVKMLANSQENLTIANGKTITLDLNGKVLTSASSGLASVIYNYGNLTVKDSDAEAVHNFKVVENDLWQSTSDAATNQYEGLTARPAVGDVIAVKGGCITGGKGKIVNLGGYANGNNPIGGAVLNYASGTFTLEGGNIVGNGINYVDGDKTSVGAGIYSRGALNVKGGRIIGNTAICNTGVGGAICAEASGSITITGGEIKFNLAKNGDGAITGGVTTSISNAVIAYNKTTAGIGSITAYTDLTVGGNVQIIGNEGADAVISNLRLANGKTITVSSTTPLIEGASIGVTTATEVTVNNPAEITSNGAATDMQYFHPDATKVGEDDVVVIYEKNSATPAVNVVKFAIPVCTIGEEENTAYYSSVSNAAESIEGEETTTVKLIRNSTEDAVITGKNIVLDLNGMTITKASGNAITVNGGSLTINSDGGVVGAIVKNGEGTTVSITTGKYSVDPTLYLDINHVAQELTDQAPFVYEVVEATEENTACICNGHVFTNLQHAIDFQTGPATITLTKDSSENFVIGAGKNITLDLNGQTLTAKSADQPVITNNGTFTLTDNSAEQTGRLTGATDTYGVVNNGTFNMLGCTIDGNKGGVQQNGTMTIGGAAKITNNTDSNLYLSSGKTIAVSTETPLTDDANIGITTQDEVSVNNPVNITSNGTAADMKHFHSDNSGYTVIYENNDEDPATPIAKLAIPAAQIGEGENAVYYSSVSKALEHIGTEPTTIKLPQNTTEDIVITNQNVTLDLNGKTITSKSGGNAITMSGGSLTINDETMAGGVNGGIAVNGGEATINNGNYDGAITKSGEGTTVAIYGGKYSEDPTQYLDIEHAAKDITGQDPYNYEIVSGDEIACLCNGHAFASLQHAIDYQTTASTITLTKDSSENFVIGSGKDITIDLNGQTLTAADASKPVVTNQGAFTLTDNSVGKTGTITGSTGTAGISNDGTFNMYGGKVTGNKNGVDNNGDLTVGGTANITGNTDRNLYLPSGKTVTVSTDTPLADDASFGVTLQDVTGNVTTASNTDYTSHFTSDNASYSIFNSGKGANQQVYIGNPVAQNATTLVYYETIQSAIDAAANGETLQMIDNATENVTIANGKVITLDLNGQTITAKSTGQPVIDNDGTFTLTDNSTEKAGRLTGSTTNFSVVNYGTSYMYAGTITGNMFGYQNIGTFNMYGGAITGNQGGVSQFGTMTIGGTANITGNVDGQEKVNLGVPTNHFFTVATGEYAPKTGMNVGVCLPEWVSGAIVPVSTDNGTTDYSKYFSADKGTPFVVFADKKDGMKLKITDEVKIYLSANPFDVATVTLVNAETGATLDPDHVQYGTTVRIKAQVNSIEEGYAFKGWFNADGTMFSGKYEYTFEATESLELEARFTNEVIWVRIKK